MNCPNCKTKMEHQAYYLDGWLLEEENFDCPECGYFISDSYGLHDEGFKVAQAETVDAPSVEVDF